MLRVNLQYLLPGTDRFGVTTAGVALDAEQVKAQFVLLLDPLLLPFNDLGHFGLGLRLVGVESQDPGKAGPGIFQISCRQRLVAVASAS